MAVDRTPEPRELMRATSPTNLFAREHELTIAGMRFRIRRLTLLEELEWYGEREKILSENGYTTNEKIVFIWESLLKKVVLEPVCQQYTEELPTPVIAKLLESIFELHLWNMDFRILRRESSSTSPLNTSS